MMSHYDVHKPMIIMFCHYDCYIQLWYLSMILYVISLKYICNRCTNTS